MKFTEDKEEMSFVSPVFQRIQYKLPLLSRELYLLQLTESDTVQHHYATKLLKKLDC